MAQYNSLLTLSLNLDLPLSLTDMMTHIMIIIHKLLFLRIAVGKKKHSS